MLNAKIHSAKEESMKYTFSLIFLFLFVSVFVFFFGGFAFKIHPVLGVIVGGFFYYMFFYTRLREHIEWSSLPNFGQYLELHSECKTGKGASCAQCNSRSIKNWGISSANDKRRVHICNHCNKKLYKSER